MRAIGETTRRKYWELSLGLAGVVLLWLTLVPAAVTKRGVSATTAKPEARGAPPRIPGQGRRPLPASGSLASQTRLLKSYRKLPLSFEANRGQADSQVKFLSRGRGYTLFLTGNEAVLRLKKSGSGDLFSRSAAFRLRSPGLVSRAFPLSFRRQAPELSSNSALGFPAAFSTFFGPPTAEPREQPAPTSATGIGQRTTDAVLRMKLVGGNPSPRVRPLAQLAGKSNYFIGNDPKKWRTNVPNYAKVEYRDVYPGVDLVYYGNQGQLEYDFVVAPGADPSQITLDLDGAVGAVREPPMRAHHDALLRINRNGDLLVSTPGGEVVFHKPVVYQRTTDNLQRTKVDSRYVLKGDREVTFEVASYDPTKPLVIDPVLSFSTYLGGSGFDWAHAVAVDHAGKIYLAGTTSSLDFPTTLGAFQTKNAGGTCVAFDIFGNPMPCEDAFVVKLNADGSNLIYSTYIGGTGDEHPFLGIAVDPTGSAYICGPTTSTDFPTTPGVFQPKYAGGPDDEYVVKLNAAGNALVFSTYLGGSGDESTGEAIAVDSTGAVYVNGMTDSADFPTTPGAFQTKNAGSFDLYVTKLTPDGSSLVYSTYLGGSDFEACAPALAVDSAGNAYVAAFVVFSTDFPTTPGAFQTTHAGGTCGTPPNTFLCPDSSVTKLSADGSKLLYSTYLGGSSYDIGFGLAIDSAGNAYTTGFTGSTDFPTTAGAFQTTYGGGPADAYVAKLNPGGTALVYSTFLGGSGDDEAQGQIHIDSSGNVYVGGLTNSTDFPTAKAFQPANAGDYDAFLTEVNAAGDKLVFSTYLGGSGFEIGMGVAVHPKGKSYLSGLTCSTDFLVANPVQPHNAGGCDAFVAKVLRFDAAGIGLSRLSVDFGTQTVGATSPPQTVTVRSVGSQPLVVSNVAVSGPFAQTNTCSGPLPSATSCDISITFTPTQQGTERGVLVVTGNARPAAQLARLSGTGASAAGPATASGISPGGQTAAKGKSGGTVTPKLPPLWRGILPWPLNKHFPQHQ